MPRPIADVLMERDGVDAIEAEARIAEAVAEIKEIIAGDGSILDLEEICYDHFGLEPDYLDELLFRAGVL